MVLKPTPATNMFIIKSNLIHGGIYGYLKVVYINNKIKVCINCKTHGDFWQTPKDHLSGSGCQKCAALLRKPIHMTKEEFIAKAIQIHGDKYDYSQVVYINSHTKVKIICPIHGVFKQRPSNHIGKHGYGCRKCGDERLREPYQNVIKKAEAIHGGWYKYLGIVYTTKTTMLRIVCPIHGEFMQAKKDHLDGHGCKLCAESLGETKISLILNKLNIRYQREYALDNSRYRYDFYLPDLNILIEYDGMHHFKAVPTWGGASRLSKDNFRDIAKNELAISKNKLLIRIPYTKYNDLENYILYSISQYYKYRYENVFYKNFLHLSIDLKLPNTTKVNDMKKYLVCQK